MEGDSPSGPSGGGKKLCLESVPGAGPKIVQLADRLKNLAETLDVSVSNLLQVRILLIYLLELELVVCASVSVSFSFWVFLF